MKLENLKIAVIGLGYVGLPLAVEFGKKRNTIGFDINKKRIKELKNKSDSTLEVSNKDLKNSLKLKLTSNEKKLMSANCYIITVPTPIDKYNRPNLKPLLDASKTVAKFLKSDDIVIYESTVYPGCTEEKCVPILEKISGLKYGKNFSDKENFKSRVFYCGYSPERINPGDKKHRLKNIIKVTSGSTPQVANLIDALYNEIIIAGTHKAKTIKIAEAAKVIENTQRDLNIAFINELAMIFEKMNIDTESVLKAAGSKWNFLPFRPGLVGGHCIGVDPYYLTHKAKSIGYNPQIILAGRRINDFMGSYVASQLVKAMIKKSAKIEKSKILIMGLTFKEDCSDIRNTRVIDIVRELKKFKCNVDIYDPLVNIKDVKKEYRIRMISSIKDNRYDSIIIAVGHKEFRNMGIKKIKSFSKKKCIIYDLKYLFKKDEVDLRL